MVTAMIDEEIMKKLGGCRKKDQYVND